MKAKLRFELPRKVRRRISFSPLFKDEDFQIVWHQHLQVRRAELFLCHLELSYYLPLQRLESRAKEVAADEVIYSPLLWGHIPCS